MKILVVGGGVAGTCSAMALRRTGADVTIVEAREDPGGDIGSFVSVASNGLRGLAAIDCLDRVRERGFSVERQRVWSGSGKLIGDVPRGRLSADPLRSVTVMRAHLVGELRQAALDAGIPIITGDRVVDAKAHDAGVQVQCASGTAYGCDLLVGADGIWSATRTILDPAAPVPAYAGLYTISGITPEADVDVPSGTFGGADQRSDFNMVFARNGAFIFLRHPDGEIWWQAQVNSDTEPARDGVEWLPHLAEVFATERVPRTIIAGAARLHRPIIHHVLDHVPTWQNGRIVLVGDSAHPVGAGQGASMAIEGALALAHAVRTSPSVGGALEAYEATRRPRIAKMLKLAEDNRGSKKAGPLRRKAEDLMMPLFFRYFYEKATSWLYADAPASL